MAQTLIVYRTARIDPSFTNFLLWLSDPTGSKFKIELIIIASDKYLRPYAKRTLDRKVRARRFPDGSDGTGPFAADNAPTFDKKLS